MLLRKIVIHGQRVRFAYGIPFEDAYKVLKNSRVNQPGPRRSKFCPHSVEPDQRQGIASTHVSASGSFPTGYAAVEEQYVGAAD